MTAMRLALAAGIFAFTFAASAQAEYVGQPHTTPAATQPAPQTTPPVFKDAGTAPPQLPAGTPGNTAAPATTAAVVPAETVPVPPDPCAGSMGNIDAYNACQDMMQKIERMKKGSAARREAYYPKPPPETPKAAPVAAEAPKPAEGEKPKTDAAKPEAATTAPATPATAVATPAPVVESPRVIGNK